MNLRAPICVLVGHIDHGKSSILDRIRGTSIVKQEAGGITQAISSTNVDVSSLKKMCGGLLEKAKLKLDVPGVLFVDTPGHFAFNNLRKRGGSIADIAILVIDINEGIKPQTIESINILKQAKTPFLIALNKLDLIPGWIKKDDLLLKSFELQNERVKEVVDKKLYEVVGKLAEFDFNGERFDRVYDYTKQVALVPLSAKTGEGIPEMIMVLCGLAQKYLEDSLEVKKECKTKATILEVKEEKGIGTAIEAILYEGELKKDDQIVIGNIGEPIVTKVRILLKPDIKMKYSKVDSVRAASGIKISCPGIKDIISGMPIRVADNNLEEIKKEIRKEIKEILIETDKAGIIIKADSLGSLEALINLLKEKDVEIKKATIGNISKKDIADASSELNPLNKVILGFNVKPLESEDIEIICDDVIYKIIENFEKWREEESNRIKFKELEGVPRPVKLQILPGCVFRQSNPAVVGVRVLRGGLVNDVKLMKENGTKLTGVKSMQNEGKFINEAKKNDEIAISLPGLIVGRHIKERDILYSDITGEEFKKLKKLKKYLNSEEIELLKEIAIIKRKGNALWGI